METGSVGMGGGAPVGGFGGGMDVGGAGMGSPAPAVGDGGGGGGGGLRGLFNKDSFDAGGAKQACGTGGCGAAQKSGGGGGAEQAAKGGGGGGGAEKAGGGGGFLKKLLGLLGKAPDFLNKIMPLIQQFAGLFGGGK